MKPKIFEIWCEGDPYYGFTACHLGYGKATTFKGACEDLASKRGSFNKFFNKSDMSYLGCRVFDNYQSAKLSYG